VHPTKWAVTFWRLSQLERPGLGLLWDFKMFFALTDLVRYKRQNGHYSDDPNRNIMALGHTGRVAEETLRILCPADMIICQRMDSLVSWAIMYFGGYTVDHVAIYIGDGRVEHMTTRGVKIHSIQALARGARILPYRVDVPKGELPEPDYRLPQLVSKNNQSGDGRYIGPDAKARRVSRRNLLIQGLQQVLGLRPLFGLKHYLDIGVCALLVDLIFWSMLGFPALLSVWAGYIPILLLFRASYYTLLRAGFDIELDPHPGLAFVLMKGVGGYIFPGSPIEGQWQIKVSASRMNPSLNPQTVLLSLNQRSDP